MDWIRWRIEDARNSRATELDLGVGYNARPSDRLTELPPEICDLTWLESLDLSGHDLTGLPLRIERLERLAKLNLSRNERIAVNGALERLPRCARWMYPGPAVRRFTALPGIV